MKSLKKVVANIKDNNLEELSLEPIKTAMRNCVNIEDLSFNLQDSELKAERVCELIDQLKSFKNLTHFTLNLKNLEL